MGRVLYAVTAWVDETFLQHRFGWLCSLHDYYGPYSRRTPNGCVFLVATVLVLVLLVVTTSGKESRAR